jgi:hypothetical protein
MLDAAERTYDNFDEASQSWICGVSSQSNGTSQQRGEWVLKHMSKHDRPSVAAGYSINCFWSEQVPSIKV